MASSVRPREAKAAAETEVVRGVLRLDFQRLLQMLDGLVDPTLVQQGRMASEA